MIENTCIANASDNPLVKVTECDGGAVKDEK